MPAKLRSSAEVASRKVLRRKIPESSNLLMKTVDEINEKLGNNTLFSASEGIKKNWKMNSNLRSSHYTTDWNELALAIA